MRKLVKGIVDFRRQTLPSYREKFARLALGQSPDTLLIACSDSRVVPNLFASTDPGDLFVIRNVGNIIPCCGGDGHSTADESEAAAIELAVMNLRVKDIIVCGHSECAAIRAIIDGREKVDAPHLRAWLRHAEPALKRTLDRPAEPALKPLDLSAEPNRHNYLSQMNVLQQIEHLKSYPVVHEKMASGQLKIHGWWFELATAHVYSYDETEGRFIEIDEQEAERILKKME